MSRISLRDYNREIEEMVDNGRIEEAIAHCRYILEQFPKHITTYRSLGKALLEAQRYGDAADIFIRVLACLPDDFISHLGMSIIREDEGDLDGAIWHMERAFEGQPSNAAVQAELRRLYGRRDGMAPNKVQLTRGAMARMSAKSHLYTQAIAELRTALADDPQRPDLQVLLARMYYLSGQRMAAIETCNTLLGKFPYCQEANRLLAELLPGTQRASEAEVNRRRLEELDPYEAHISPAAPAADQVSAGTITLERLDYLDVGAPATASTEPQRASSLGVTIQDSEKTEEGLPEWLSTSDESAGQIAEEAVQEPALTAQEEIPEWMQAAGWGPSSGASEEALPGLQAGQETKAESGELASAEIPDWLRTLAPEQEEESTSELPLGAALAGVGAAGAAAFAADQSEEGAVEDLGAEKAETREEIEPAIPGAMAAAAAGSASREEISAGEATDQQPAGPPEEAVEPEAGGELPDWLSPAAEEPAAGPPEEELPDWLTAAEEEMPQQPEPGVIAAASGAAPSLAQEVEEQPASGLPPSVSEWLEESQAEAGAESGPESTDEEVTPESLPEWLAQLSPQEPAKDEALLPEEEPVEGQIPVWLRDMEESAPSKPETGAPEAIESAALAAETPASTIAGSDIPDWLKAAMAAEVAEEWTDRSARVETPAEPAIIAGDTKPVRIREEEAEIAVDLGPAEKSPAYEVSAVEEAPGEEAAVQPPPIEEFPAGEIQAEAVPFEQRPGEEEVLAVLPVEGMPGGVPEIESLQPLPEQPSEEVPSESPPAFEDEEAAMAWLESMAARQGAMEEELLTKPEERPEEAPEWVLQYGQEEQPEPEAEERPGWLGAAVAAAVTGELIKEEHGEEAAEEVIADEAIESAMPSEWIPEEPAPELGAVALAAEAAIAGEDLEKKADEAAVEGPTGAEVELPDWLRDYEGEVAEPSAEVAALDFETPAETPEIASAEPVPEMSSPLDVNAASLSQLERIPGIGFINAQNIVTFREANGPFTSLAELQNIPGITAETADDLQHWLTVEVVSEVAAPPTTIPELAEARQAISAGNVDSAVDQYTQLIRQDRDLDEVIKEIQRALVIHPLDPLLCQTLGDAYLRTDRLQEALDAYNRAEDLLK